MIKVRRGLFASFVFFSCCCLVDITRWPTSPNLYPIAAACLFAALTHIMSKDQIAGTDDVDKLKAELVDDVDLVQKAAAADHAQLEGAIGYKEYLEAIHLDVSDKEVCCRAPSFRWTLFPTHRY